MNAGAQAIYNRLLEMPRDRATMLVLADALMDSGEEDLAAAYRWAASESKWPFQRPRWNTEEKVYDWDSDDGERQCLVQISQDARLPHKLFRHMALAPAKEKKYGDVNDAFVLLARALKETR